MDQDAIEIIDRLNALLPIFRFEKSGDHSIILRARSSSSSETRDQPIVKFVLHKTGRETHHLFRNFQKKTGIGKRDYAIAGTKDKDGVTNFFVI